MHLLLGIKGKNIMIIISGVIVGSFTILVIGKGLNSVPYAITI